MTLDTATNPAKTHGWAPSRVTEPTPRTLFAGICELIAPGGGATTFTSHRAARCCKPLQTVTQECGIAPGRSAGWAPFWVTVVHKGSISRGEAS